MLGKHSDLLYADPPYNSREYLPNYHVLETILLKMQLLEMGRVIKYLLLSILMGISD